MRELDPCAVTGCQHANINECRSNACTFRATTSAACFQGFHKTGAQAQGSCTRRTCPCQIGGFKQRLNHPALSALKKKVLASVASQNYECHCPTLIHGHHPGCGYALSKTLGVK
jgi:hypothetical protein